MAENKLTDKQQAFVEAYLANGFNATKAALAAGYSEANARKQGSENLTKPDIASRVRARMQELAMQADEVLARLSEQARGDIREFVDIDYSGIAEHPRGVAIKKLKRTVRTDKDGGITEYTEIEMYDAQTALTTLGKHHALFVERQEHTGKDGGAIKFYGGWSPDEWDKNNDET